MKKHIIIWLVLTLFAFSACTQTEERPSDEISVVSVTEKSSSESKIQPSEDSIIIWNNTLPETADKLTYTVLGETESVYEVTDKEVIDKCISALKAITVADQTDTRYSDDTEILVFTFENGSEYRTIFEHGNYVYEKAVYKTNGYTSFLDIVADDE